MGQQELKLAFGMVKAIPPATPAELLRVHTEGDAWMETLRRSGRPRKAIVHEVGINNTTLSKVFSNERTMPEKYREAFMDACGNDFWLDWMAFRRGKRVVERERTIEEKAALFDLMQAAG